MFNEYAKYYDLIYKDKPYKKECGFVYRWAEYPNTMLDLGCGTANYWQHFPAQMITGIEMSQDMINRSRFQARIYKGNILRFNFRTIVPLVNCVTALFNVMNYLPSHNWWKRLPINKGGYFIFDIWNKDKTDQDGFKCTALRFKKFIRVIIPERHGNRIKLRIMMLNKEVTWEIHKMYLYSENDLKKFCGKEFKIVDKKETKTWQTWYKLRRL